MKASLTYYFSLKVRGSADGLFPPGLAHISDSISMFSTDLCRPLTFSKSGEASLHGVPVTTFDLAADNFANSSVCPDNKCYQNNIPTGVQVTPSLHTNHVFQIIQYKRKRFMF